MDNKAADYIRALQTVDQLQLFIGRLQKWLIDDQNENSGISYEFTEMRAKALLLGADLIDEATLNDFYRVVGNESGSRIALLDLLTEIGIAEDPALAPLAAAAATTHFDTDVSDRQSVNWLVLFIAGYSWKNGYPLLQLDPTNPPESGTPAGQLLRRAAHLLRRQITRSATEKEKLSKELALPPSDVPTLDEMTPSSEQIAPMPPHFRPPIPETYPETARESIHLDSDEIGSEPRIEIGDPLVISSEELESPGSSHDPIRMPPISIEADQLTAEPTSPPSPLPANAVVMPTSTTQSRPGLSMSIRQMFRNEEMTTVKLRVLVQEYPDGPGLYGLQVKVTSKGIKSYVAGTTDREGRFVCELPVRLRSGLTYDIQVTWPRDVGGDTEQKSITLNADRTLFTVPFYRQLSTPTTE